MATGYFNTFITISLDCPMQEGIPPAKPQSVAGLEYSLLMAEPYRLTGDALILAVHLRREGIGCEGDLEAVREVLFAKPHPCLRASMLPKRYGWGAHYDENGRIAIHGAGTEAYRRLASSESLKVIPAMRNNRPSSSA